MEQLMGVKESHPLGSLPLWGSEWVTLAKSLNIQKKW